jgi:hypothetical protein
MSAALCRRFRFWLLFSLLLPATLFFFQGRSRAQFRPQGGLPQGGRGPIIGQQRGPAFQQGGIKNPAFRPNQGGAFNPGIQNQPNMNGGFPNNPAQQRVQQNIPQMNQPNVPNIGIRYTETSWCCTRCNKEVARGPTRPVLDSCPHCGARFRKDGNMGPGGSTPGSTPSSSPDTDSGDFPVVAVVVPVIVLMVLGVSLVIIRGMRY